MVEVFGNVLVRHDGLPKTMQALFLSFYEEGLLIARKFPDGVNELLKELREHGSIEGTIQCFTDYLPDDSSVWLPESISQAGHDYIEKSYGYLTVNLYPWAAWLRSLYYIRLYSDYAFWAGLYQGNPDPFHALSKSRLQ